MGRPRRHGAQTADALLEAAEAIVERDGVDALTVRRLAEAGGTTTRAVYTLYGSKDGLVVALGRRAFDLLRTEVEAVPETEDPAADLIEAGVTVFRRLAVEHPALYRIGVQWGTLPEPDLARGFLDSAEAALQGLRKRVARLDVAGLLGGRSVPDATRTFHALCEGLAALELRGLFPPADGERIWRDSLEALVRGFRVPPARRP